MVWSSVNTFAWLLILRKLLKEKTGAHALLKKSDKLDINQMDVFFVDLRSFMLVSET